MAFLEPNPTRCANPECVKHTEGGGKFVFANGQWYCERCAGNSVPAEPGKELYNFTTTHLDGYPIQVRGKNHLRQLEKQYGVSSVVLNNSEKNWSRA